MVVVVVTLSLLASALSLVVVVGRCSRGWRSRGYVSLQVFPIILSILSHPLHLSQSYCGCSLSFYQKLFLFTQKKGFLFMAKDCLVWPKGIYVSQNVPNIWPNRIDRRYLMDGLLNGRTTIKKKTLPITVPITNESIYVFTCVLPDSTIFFQIGAIEPPISLMDTTSGGLLVFCSPSFTFWMLTMFEPDVIIMNNVISERPLTSCGHAGGMFTNGPRTAVCCQWLYEQSFSTSRSSSIFKM